MATGLVAGTGDHSRGFRRIVALLILLVTVPTAFLLVVGILMLVLWRYQLNVPFGILLVSLVACMVTGVVLSLVFLRREAALSRLQLDFVSKVSHELRTPLTSIRMFVDMLEGARPEELPVCIEVLRKETNRLSGRIERLLDWGRMEAGRHIYHRQPDTVEAVVSEALIQFQAASVGRERAVTLELAPGLPAVHVDRGALVDALVNLLVNAAKYSDEASAVILRASTDGRAVRLSVTDQGIGIPRREHRNIFEKFYRVDDRLSRAVEGTGLGLAIVQHIAQGHGGHVEVESEPQKGSTFTIVLPFAKTVAPAGEGAPSPA